MGLFMTLFGVGMYGTTVGFYNMAVVSSLCLSPQSLLIFKVSSRLTNLAHLSFLIDIGLIPTGQEALFVNTAPWCFNFSLLAHFLVIRSRNTRIRRRFSFHRLCAHTALLVGQNTRVDFCRECTQVSAHRRLTPCNAPQYNALLKIWHSAFRRTCDTITSKDVLNRESVLVHLNASNVSTWHESASANQRSRCLLNPRRYPIRRVRGGHAGTH